MVAVRVSDERVLRLIRRILRAGVMEEGRRLDTEQGTPQGGVILGTNQVRARYRVHHKMTAQDFMRESKAAPGFAYLGRRLSLPTNLPGGSWVWRRQFPA
jgi:hypothetical protein